MDSEEDVVIIIFMNSFNAIHTFTALKMEIINDANLLKQQPKFELANESRKCISSFCPKNQFLILSTFFVTTIAVHSPVFFSDGCFFHQNTLK